MRWALLLVCTLSVTSRGAERRFGDFGYLPPIEEGYEGRIFRLSQDYPPKVPDERPAFLRIDFRSSWREYVMAARAYCFDGNITGSNVEDDFDVARNSPTHWFHMPWQHYGKSGREGIHGLTKEAKIKPHQIAASQTSTGQTYAVAFYNEFGGYQIREVWKDPDKPNLHGAKFPIGTVVFKLLFADIPLSEVPYLDPPLQWPAYVTETYESDKRMMKKLALIQMDAMVRDERAPQGWVFITFQYNGAQKRDNSWENLVPIGIQWGNDPEIREHQVDTDLIKTVRNASLKETIINPDDNELPPTHLGWNGRLNGPVDNPQSSCMSCHATAQMREKSPLGPMFLKSAPAPGSDEWMRWFQNYKCGGRFDNDVPSADFSLQLAISVQNYLKWLGEKRGVSAVNYAHQVKKAKQPLKYSETVIEDGVPQERPQILRDVPD
jgi:hypothetical protein